MPMKKETNEGAAVKQGKGSRDGRCKKHPGPERIVLLSHDSIQRLPNLLELWRLGTDMSAKVIEPVNPVKIQRGAAYPLQSGKRMSRFIVDGDDNTGRNGKHLRLGKAVGLQHPANGFFHSIDFCSALQQSPTNFSCYFQQLIIVHLAIILIVHRFCHPSFSSI